MYPRAIGLLIASVGVLGAFAPGAFAAAATSSACIAQFTSNSEPGGVAETIRPLTQELRPFGRAIPSFGTPGQPTCEE